MKTLIIAEAGVNHNGDINLAKKLIDAAAEAGADYVKFQTFKASKLVSSEADTADYQKKNTDDNATSQLEMLKKLELSEEEHHTLIAHCKTKNINFLSTGFDLDSLDFLYNLGIRMFKVPSGELTNLPYLEKIAQLADSIILSTGMSTMQEISDALVVLRSNPDIPVTVLHCNTEYPTPFTDVNLRAMNTLQTVFNVNIGYSDHTLGIEVPIAAVALGATIIEKHFTLDCNMPGPDHAASLEPAELMAMVKAIRNIDQALGSAEKLPTPSELKNISVARKSIHLSKNLSKGQVLTESDFEMLRPGDGISPMLMRSLIGKKINLDLPKGHKLTTTDIEQ
jgi:N-acetylneuraminate synthase